MANANEANAGGGAYQRVPPIGLLISVADLESAQFALNEEGAAFLKSQRTELTDIPGGRLLGNHFINFGTFGDVTEEGLEGFGIEHRLLELRQRRRIR